MSALEQVQGLLGKKLRVSISDGRVIEGDLQCMDKDLNIILGSAIEYYGIEDGKTIITYVSCKLIFFLLRASLKLRLEKSRRITSVGI